MDEIITPEKVAEGSKESSGCLRAFCIFALMGFFWKILGPLMVFVIAVPFALLTSLIPWIPAEVNVAVGFLSVVAGLIPAYFLARWIVDAIAKKLKSKSVSEEK